jgi:hypothetical protein
MRKMQHKPSTANAQPALRGNTLANQRMSSASATHRLQMGSVPTTQLVRSVGTSTTFTYNLPFLIRPGCKSLAHLQRGSRADSPNKPARQ